MKKLLRLTLDLGGKSCPIPSKGNNFEDEDSKIKIMAGFNKELDNLRELYDNLDDILTIYAHKEIN